jgi:hypothetical protein
VDALSVEAWADHATQSIWRELRTDVPQPMTQAEVASAIRAAYARGYCDALADEEPLTIREAMERELILSTLLPVV